MTHPYAPFVHKVAKPSRYVGGEYNQVRKDWATVDARVCLAFPDVYDVGMSHLGTKILYGILNRAPDLLAERTFAPWGDMESELRKRGLPLLSLESAQPLSAFDVVGFSLQYELTFTNVLTMLDLGGIPLRAASRGEDTPLVIAGGPVATHPEPVAPFIDAIVIGDGEEKLPELVRVWTAGKRQGLDRRARLVQLAKLGGIYVPSLYHRAVDPDSGFMVVTGPVEPGVPFPVERVLLDDLNRYPFPDDSPEPVAEAIFDRMSMEIARGCTEGCRFCQAGMIYRPVRERDPEAIVDTLVSAIEKGGYDEASLTSLSTADYSCVAPLIKNVMGKLRERKVSLSVSSLRAYGLGDETLDELKSGRVGGLTFAPEAGTQRMRDVINKNVSEQDIVESAHRIFSKGWTKMKLYFMIGLPTETDEDVLGIVGTGGRVRDVGTNYHPRRAVDVTCSVSSHVPKPHTPFQWAAMDSLSEIKRKQGLLGRRSRELGVNVKWHDLKTSHIEGVVARGDWRVADAVELAWQRGARFDGWDEMLRYDEWLRTFEECGIDPALPLGTIAVDARVPWDHISVGLEDDFLLREYRKALKGRLSPPCGKPKGQLVHHTNLPDHQEDERKLVCYHCGIACDLSQMRESRADYLDAMGATERVAPRVSVEQLLKTGKIKQRIPDRPPQGPFGTYRVSYTKLGPARLTSHLDLVRKLPRVFRRAGLSMRNSQGFNPKPLLSFAPALPLGVFSTLELLDIDLHETLDGRTLVERLNAVAPEGLRFLEARRLVVGEPGVSRFVRQAEYLADAGGEFSATSLQEAVDRALAASEVTLVRTSRKSEVSRPYDARGAIVELEVLPREALAALDPDLGIVAGPVLRMRVRLDTTMSPKPEELLEYLLGRPLAEAPKMARVGLFGFWEGEVLAPLAAWPGPLKAGAQTTEDGAGAEEEASASDDELALAG
jgi:radical SAM family uncharacterized protein/radical SAM-linked protein